MFCHYCGKEIDDSESFCPFCGNKVRKPAAKSETAKAAPAEENKNNKTIIIIVIAAAAVLIAVAAFFFLGRGDTDATDTSNGESATQTTEPVTETEQGSSIPAEAKEFNGHFYSIYNQGTSWTAAKQECERAGGHLVTITSQDEQNFIDQLIATDGKKHNYWIGATDYGYATNDFHWVTGEGWGYTNFPPTGSQPDSKPGQDYIEIGSSTNYSLKWCDMSDDGHSAGYEGSPWYKTTEEHAYICEWE